MSIVSMPLIALAMVGLGAAMLGAVLALLVRRLRKAICPLSVDGLAEQADINGFSLVVMAREMKAMALAEGRGDIRKRLRQWARLCERAAVDHLTCINALSLEAQQALTERPPIHLGDFKPHSDRRRNPPLKNMAEMMGSRHG